MNTYAAIMAGGIGSRFWPLSRKSRPKQLLRITGKNVMLNDTIFRIEGIILSENIYIITNADQEYGIKSIMPDIIPLSNLIIEPLSLNTAPPILYLCAKISRCEKDAVLCIFPSDHYIADIDSFRKSLIEGIETALYNDSIVSFGIAPSFPSDGYGYIKTGRIFENNIYNVDSFTEKPSRKVAQMYINSGNYLWNSGIYISRISVLQECYKKFLPEIYRKLYNPSLYNTIFTIPDNLILKEAYSELNPVSFDYGIMEKADNIFVIKGNFGWNDLGDWQALRSVMDSDQKGNVVKGSFTSIDTDNCIIYSMDSHITTIGVSNMIVVNTGDAILICPVERSQDVRLLVKKLEEQNISILS